MHMQLIRKIRDFAYSSTKSIDFTSTETVIWHFVTSNTISVKSHIFHTRCSRNARLRQANRYKHIPTVLVRQHRSFNILNLCSEVWFTTTNKGAGLCLRHKGYMLLFLTRMNPAGYAFACIFRLNEYFICIWKTFFQFLKDGFKRCLSKTTYCA